MIIHGGPAALPPLSAANTDRWAELDTARDTAARASESAADLKLHLTEHVSVTA